MVPAAGAPVISTMDEWDTRPSVSEKFSIANLEPFYSQHTPPPGVLKEGRSRRSSGSFTSRRPPTKRKKVEEEMGSLDELITLVLDPSRAMLCMLTTTYQASLHSRSSQIIASRIAPCPT